MDPFLGEIRPFPFTFAPLGWMFCDGSLLPISAYDALYTLLGTTYGGDGVVTFALPDLRGRVPNHQGSLDANYVIGQLSGEETVSLNGNQVPGHTHGLRAGGTGTSATPVGNYPANDATSVYGTDTASSLASNAVAPNSPSGVPHNNLQPYLAISYCIAVEGSYPTQN